MSGLIAKEKICGGGKHFYFEREYWKLCKLNCDVMSNDL